MASHYHKAAPGSCGVRPAACYLPGARQIRKYRRLFSIHAANLELIVIEVFNESANVAFGLGLKSSVSCHAPSCASFVPFRVISWIVPSSRNKIIHAHHETSRTTFRVGWFQLSCVISWIVPLGCRSGNHRITSIECLLTPKALANSQPMVALGNHGIMRMLIQISCGACPDQLRGLGPLAGRRFKACEASALARLIFSVSSGGPPTLRRRKTSPFRT